jgi:TusA-related sulfurtransferase
MLDVRGLNCPMPVLAVQKEVKKNQPQELEVLADHMTAVYNITRFGNSQEYRVEYKENADGDYVITLKK